MPLTFFRELVLTVTKWTLVVPHLFFLNVEIPNRVGGAWTLNKAGEIVNSPNLCYSFYQTINRHFCYFFVLCTLWNYTSLNILPVINDPNSFRTYFKKAGGHFIGAAWDSFKGIWHLSCINWKYGPHVLPCYYEKDIYHVYSLFI